MLKAWLRLVCLMLLPVVLVAGAPGGAYALFECSVTRTLQAHCCCTGQRVTGSPTARQSPRSGQAKQSDAPCPDQVERAGCCSERWVDAQLPVQNHDSRPATPPVLAQSYVRLQVRELYHVLSAPSSFAVREAPRAIGPPLILLYRVLRL